MQRRSFLKQSTWIAAGLSVGPLACYSNHKKDTQVLILGAGLAGLHAASLLQEKGIDYKILEASDRVGGRVFTKKIKGFDIEFGAVEIGDGYKRVVDTANALNVELVSPAGYPKEWCIHYRGKNINSKDWASASVNTLPVSLKDLAPYRLESAAIRGKIPFKNISDWYQEDHKALDFPYIQFLKEAGYEKETLRLANLTANHNGIEKVSTLQIMRSMAYRMMGGSKAVLNIKGGTSQLPKAMAKELAEPVLLNKKVTKINEDKNIIVIECEDGTRYRSDRLLCTIPFSVLKDIPSSIGFSNIQKQAIQQLPYTKVTTAIVAVKNKFWETDELPISMWSDSPIERVFVANNKSDEQTLLKVFINGQAASVVDQLSKSERHQFIQKTFHQIRPSTQNNIEVLDSFSWGSYPFNKGAYAEYHAGQVNKFVPELAKPTERVFLAGEHTSFEEKGMEGAMASAEHAVNELLKNIKQQKYD